MATGEDIMLRVSAQDNASNVIRGIKGNVQGLGTSGTSAIRNFADSFSMIDAAVMGTVGTLGGKTINDLIFGTSSTAETNKILLKNMSETEASAKSLYQNVDDVTNKSLISMQQLIPVMKAFKSATGANDETMQIVTEDIANFGTSVLATTGSTELAQTAMEKLSYGIKGSYAALDQFGITEESLMRTGLWTGREDDVKGYMAAITAVTGNTEELMNTNQGLDAQIQKTFSRAGKSIGNDLLPGLKEAKKGFLALNSSMDGKLAESILLTGEGVSLLTQGLSAIGMATNGIIALKDGYDAVTSSIKGATSATKLFNTAQTATDVASSATGIIANGSGAGTKATAEYMKGVRANKGSIQDIIKALYPEKAGTKAVGETVDNIAGGLKGVGSKSIVASTEANMASVGLKGLSGSITSMIVPILKISVVIAIIIPIIAVLAAEALIFLRLIGDFIKSLDFKSLNLKSQIEGIKQIGSAMWEMTRAFGAMTLLAGVTIIYNAINALTFFINPVQIAVAQIKQVVPIINQLKGIDNIDKSIPSKLQSLANTLKSVSIAMDSLANVTWNMYMGNLMTLGGRLGSFTSTLESARDDINGSVKIINSMKNLNEIDKGAADKLKSVSEALLSFGNAIKALSGISVDKAWSDWINGGALSNITKTLQDARQDISDVAPVLNSFRNISNVSPEAGKKIKAVADTVKPVNEALKSLNGINWEQKWSATFGGFINSLKEARTSIGTASIILAGFKNIANIPEGVGSKLQRIGWTSTTVLNTIKSLNNVPKENVNFGDLVNNLRKARTTIGEVSVLLHGFKNIANIDGMVSTKVQRVGWTLFYVSNAVKALNSVPFVLPNNNNNNVGNAVQAIKSTIHELSKLENSKSVNVSSVISSVSKSMKQISNVLGSNVGVINSKSVIIGLNISKGIKSGIGTLSNVMVPPMNIAMNVLKSSGQTGGTNAGNAFKNSFKIASATRAEMDYAIQAITSKTPALVAAARAAGEKTSQTYKDANKMRSPGIMARSTLAEMNYMIKFVVDSTPKLAYVARMAANAFVNGWNKPGLEIANDINRVGNPTLTRQNIDTMNFNNDINPNNRNSQGNTVINIHEGAVQLDARNLTTKECKQIMINAYEGLDQLKNTNIRGIGG